MSRGLPPDVVSLLEAIQDGTFIRPTPPEEATPLEAKARKREANAARKARLREKEKRRNAELRLEKRLGLREFAKEDELDVARRKAARKRKKEVFYTMSSQAFEEFVQRRLAPELREGAPPPATWDGTKEEWESLRQQAEDTARERLAAEFAEAIALRGLTPEEIASGTLNDGSEIGKVVQR